MEYDWDFSAVFLNLRMYVRGAAITLELAGGAILLGTIVAIPIALALRLSKIMSIPLRLIIEIMRAVPDIVWMFAIYFFPYQSIFGISPITPFLSALAALTLVLALFAGVLISSGLEQVPRSQILGGQALGFRPIDMVRHIHLPAVTRQCLPGLISLWVGILKATSLASVIGVTDVVFVAKADMAQNARSLEAWITVASFYILLVSPVTLLLRGVERMNFFQRQ